jgi:hypothetical protein
MNGDSGSGCELKLGLPQQEVIKSTNIHKAYAARKSLSLTHTHTRDIYVPTKKNLFNIYNGRRGLR